MDLLFENGDMVKVIVSFAPVKKGKGSMIWKSGIIVGAIDFGYEVLCEGEVIEVSTTNLERLTEVNNDE
jgi:hypothetical protein